MSRTVQRKGSLAVALRTEGAIIIPKMLREGLDLRPGDLLDIEVQGRNIILRPRPAGRLLLRGVPVVAQDSIVGAVRLGGNAVTDKKRLYEH